MAGFAAVQGLADQHLDAAAETLYGRLDHHVSRLDAKRDPDTFLKAVVVYHLIAEGVVARTAQNLAAPMYERFGDFPGLARGQRLVARDEARHIGIGVSYCRERMTADPADARTLVAEVIEEFTDVAAALLETTSPSWPTSHARGTASSRTGSTPRRCACSSSDSARSASSAAPGRTFHLYTGPANGPRRGRDTAVGTGSGTRRGTARQPRRAASRGTRARPGSPDFRRRSCGW